MSQVVSLYGQVVDLTEFRVQLENRTVEQAKRAATNVASTAARELKRRVSKRGGPSKPGEPPRVEEDHLHQSIGYSRGKVEGRLGTVGPSGAVSRTAAGTVRAYRQPQELIVSAGFGVGLGLGYRNLQKSIAQGVNVFEYALLLEQGGITFTTASTRAGSSTWARIEPRPWFRPTSAKIPALVDREWRRAAQEVG